MSAMPHVCLPGLCPHAGERPQSALDRLPETLAREEIVRKMAFQQFKERVGNALQAHWPEAAAAVRALPYIGPGDPDRAPTLLGLPIIESDGTEKP